MSSEGAKFPYVGESVQRFPPNADDGPVATASKATQTKKVDLLDATQNKENTATPPASHKKLLKLCALSDVVITSFSPRETGVKTEKSFTCVRKPSTPTISTSKSVLSELNGDLNSCSRDLLDFSTPSTSKKVRRETSTSMYLIDLTPQKLRPTLKLTPISVSGSADESSDASPLVKPNRTKSDTPPSSAPSHQVAKRTPQSLMKQALLTSPEKQIAANSVEATTPVATPKRPSLLMARRKFLKPVRLPFHPQKRTPAQVAADNEKAKSKCPSLFFLSPRKFKAFQMRKQMAKDRRSLSNSTGDGSPKPGSETQGDLSLVEELVEVVKELPQSSPKKEEVSPESQSDSSQQPVPNAPISTVEESTSLCTEIIQSIQSGSRRNRNPATSVKTAANTSEAEASPTTPATATPTTPEIPTVTLPDPTTSQRREGRNLPRKSYTEAPDDDKPTPSRSWRQRNPTGRKGKAGAEEPHEEEPPVKKAVTEVAEDAPAVATTAAVKGRGTRRKAEDVAEAESAEMEEAEPKAAARKNARGNARKAKVGTEPDPEAQPVAKKARGGARAKTPLAKISDGKQPEPTKEPVGAVTAKKPAGRGRGRAAKAAPIVEPEAEQPAPSTEAAAPSAPKARKKVHLADTPDVAESAPSSDKAPKRAPCSRRK
ncbi:mediator of DNA damage checkpoint protein 1-like [Drosophila obscura]|uniref:mediator of DNA damage checkpoint protein 1-like n=1 Tax=Drosophila obscura TaxID=7282 RepID=UPI001BB1607D|nr:mediator of DNA damage checkpoint protein 1-like [Drosophila obscura]